jgi:hypothetical protein
MKKLLMAFAVLCSVSALHAEPDYYAALCAWAPGQLPSSSSSVIWGIRGTLFYGDHLRMEGLDLAIGANRTRERFDGLGIAFVYNYANSLAGMELGFANVVERETYGVQLGAWNHAGEGYGEQRGIVNTAGYCAGLQDGFFNWSDDLVGVQCGTFNIVYNEMAGTQLGALWNHADAGYGVQWGVFNTADYFAGLQVGLFNWANDLDGLQLGFINVIANQTVCVFPFLNIGF